MVKVQHFNLNPNFKYGGKETEFHSVYRILLIYNLLKPNSYTKIILASCTKFRYDQVGGMYDRLLLKNLIEKNV